MRAMSTNRHEVRAVVFDMDGVLIDSHPAHQAAWREFLHTLGKEVCDQELEFILEGHTRTEILCHFLGSLTAQDLELYGRRKDQLFRAHENHVGLISGVCDFLRKLSLHRIPAGVATSASEIRTVSTIERMGLAELFEAVVTASDVEKGKPDPCVYRLACERLKVPPQHALAFDDAPAGIQSAKSAGLRCIGISSNGLTSKLLDAGAETVIADFASLTIEDILRRA
jgi:HAD superfamily hydrolase (TIGR01509 family)